MAISEQTRDDLRIADKVVQAVWSNFVATEPTYVLRDLIVIEIEKTRMAEREACAKVLDDRAQELRRQRDPGMANHCQSLATAIRNRTNT